MIYTLKHGPFSIAKYLISVAHKLGTKGDFKEVLITTSSVHEQLVTGSASFSAAIFREKLTWFIAVLH